MSDRGQCLTRNIDEYGCSSLRKSTRNMIIQQSGELSTGLVQFSPMESSMPANRDHRSLADEDTEVHAFGSDIGTAAQAPSSSILWDCGDKSALSDDEFYSAQSLRTKFRSEEAGLESCEEGDQAKRSEFVAVSGAPTQLPHPVHIPSPALSQDHDRGKRRGLVGSADEMWNQFSEELKTRDEAMAQVWKDELDALLVFAGLFSAIVTAFNVELYKALKPTPVPDSDQSMQTLIYLARMMGNGSPPIIINTSSADSPGTSSSLVWINAVFFTSLVLSISAASINIAIRQWLNHFTSPIPGDGVLKSYIHCLRWDKGLTVDYIPEILRFLPLLLQLALALFLVGLLGLLWTLNRDVAIVTSICGGLLLAFTLYTTLAPIWDPYCPYKSAQSLLIGRFVVNTLLQLARCGRRKDHPLSAGQAQLHRYLHGLGLYRNWTFLEQLIVHPVRGDYGRHNEVMTWIKENVFARGHILLMDEKVLHEVVVPCIDRMGAQLSPNDLASLPLSESPLRILLRLFESHQPMSTSIRLELAEVAVKLIQRMPRCLPLDETTEQIWALVPHRGGTTVGESDGAKVLTCTLKITHNTDPLTFADYIHLGVQLFFDEIMAYMDIYADNAPHIGRRGIQKALHVCCLGAWIAGAMEETDCRPDDMQVQKLLAHFNSLSKVAERHGSLNRSVDAALQLLNRLRRTSEASYDEVFAGTPVDRLRSTSMRRVFREETKNGGGNYADIRLARDPERVGGAPVNVRICVLAAEEWFSARSSISLTLRQIRKVSYSIGRCLIYLVLRLQLGMSGRCTSSP
ncbi:hypothetical protein CERSUDRAFT_124588 [Gelatoporia subvermispora B]|uniref:DUF6535 domain-containing protein n=1 Tax=Ceriporiopsis subvermispora (strain B) TaxID=914234 RepID=M2RBB2_CERS8|nr:hypothetical protein CERSUDRAFT_124588 [Gelatoporia subvermispora B]